MINNNVMVYIILPVYNCERYFLEQLMSIYYQNYENRFLIIVNDGSTDSSLEIANNFVINYKLENKVKIITKENGGVNSAMTVGLEELKKITDVYSGDILVAYCDSDDIWTREKLSVQVNYMQNHPDCDLSYHDIAEIDENGIITNPSLHKKCYHDNSFFYLATISTHMWSTELMFRSKYIDSIIPLPSGFGMYQDYRTVLIISLQEGKFHFINRQLGYYRHGHTSSLTAIQKTSNDDTLAYFTSLQKKFPNKDLSYILSYWKDRYYIRCEKKYSAIHLYIIMLFKYPRVFFLGLKVVLYKLLKFGSLKQ